MRANRAFRLIIRRGGWLPPTLADAGRVDHVEVVEVDSGEVVLFWELPPLRAARTARALRADLSRLEASDFLERWTQPEHTTDLEQETGQPSERPAPHQAHRAEP